MQVMTRKVGEGIMIGKGIEVTLIGVSPAEVGSEAVSERFVTISVSPSSEVFPLKKGESRKIGEGMEITLVKFCGSKMARLGITAPLEVKVHRTEVYLDIKAGKPKPSAGEKSDEPWVICLVTIGSSKMLSL